MKKIFQPISRQHLYRKFKKRIRKGLQKSLQNDRGSALMMALFTTVVVMTLAAEISYQANVESRISSNALDEIKAYYAAKSGVELGLFRVLLYRKAVAAIGNVVPDPSLLDMIWNIRFSWPPDIIDSASTIDKNNIKEAVKNSTMQAKYTMLIESESSKIDVNDLASPSQLLADSARKQLMQIFENEMKNNEEFSKNHRNYNFNRLIGNITDWIDEDNRSQQEGSDEKSLYADISEAGELPPNQPFKTLGELHMVAGMTDEFYNLLAPHITIYGSKGINVNYAPKEVLQAAIPTITDKIAEKIIDRRSNASKGGLFTSPDDFFEFIQGAGAKLESPQQGGKISDSLPVFTDPEFNFRIQSVGSSGKISKKITVLTYDFDSVKERFSDFIKRQSASKNPAAAAGTPSPPNNNPPGNNPNEPNQKQPAKKQVHVPKGRPNIVEWWEE